MSFNHAVVWLDHSKAQIIHFSLEESESESVKSHSAHLHPHPTHGDSVSRDDPRFYTEIAEMLKESQEVLIVGPAEEKLSFSKYLTSHLPAIADKVKGVETVDHPTEGQLLAYARKHFLKDGALS